MGSLDLSCSNVVLITLKSYNLGLKVGRSRLSLLTSKVFMPFDIYTSKAITSSGFTHQS